MATSKKNRKYRKPKPHLLVRLTWFFFWIAVVAMTGAAGAAVGGLLGYLSKQPPYESLEYYAPPQVTEVVDRTGRNVIATLFEEKREVIPYSQIPQRLIDAFLAVEDSRFHQHFGVDPLGILRALWVNYRAGRVIQGGSTITVQLPRNIDPSLQKRKTERSYNRKIVEAFAAFQIEQHFSKDQILEFYLNHIEFSQLSHGVQAAARTYFNKPVADLTIGECAVLAALPKAPTDLNPFLHPERAKKRRNIIIDRMADLGMIDRETAEREKSQPLLVASGTRPRFTSPYFKDFVEESIRNDPDYGKRFLAQGGHRVYATMDTEFQRILEEELSRNLPEVEKLWQQRKPQRYQRELKMLMEKGLPTTPAAKQERLARIIQVQKTGITVDIEGYRGFARFEKEMVYSSRKRQWIWEGKYLKPYYDPETALRAGKLIDVYVSRVYPTTRRLDVALADYRLGQDIPQATRIQGAAVLLDAKTGQVLALSGGYDFFDQVSEGMFNRATMGGRQAGSAFKPLLYAIAVDKGMTASKVIMDSRVVYAKGYTPRNYENRYFGPTTLIEALVHSRNVVTVKLFRQVGVDRAIQGYRAFDISRPKLSWYLPPELSVCLGSMDATPLSIAAAYTAFVRRGIATEPICYTKITDLRGEMLEEIQPREKRAISPQAAYITTCMLMEAMRSGTGWNIYKNFNPVKTPQMAGKTGTTSNNVDAWFVGYTPDLVLVVCVGFDRQRSLGPEMTGSVVAGPIWTKMMQRLLATRSQWTMQFEVPQDIVFRDISATTGLLIPPGNPNGEKVIASVPFVRGTEPSQRSAGYSGSRFWESQHPDSDLNREIDASSSPSDLEDEMQGTGEFTIGDWSSDEVQVEGGISPDEAQTGRSVRDPLRREMPSDPEEEERYLRPPWE